MRLATTPGVTAARSLSGAASMREPVPHISAHDPEEEGVKHLFARDRPVAQLGVIAKKLTKTRVGTALRVGCLRSTLIVSALAGAAYIWWAPSPLNYDSAYALVWGRQILNGQIPNYAAFGAPTPHPILTAISVLAALTGEHAYTLLVLLGCLSWGVLLYAVVRLGQALGSVLSGVLAAGLLAFSGVFVTLGTTGEKDVPYVALLVGAITLEVRRRRRGVPVLVLLGLAGLVRPEAWLLSAAYWLYLARCAPMSRQLATLALAAAPLMIWALADLAVTGNPAYSFTYTRNFTLELARRTGLHGADWVLGHELPDVVTWPVLLGGTVAIAWAALRRQRKLLVLSMVALLMGTAFVLQGIAGFAVTGPLPGRLVVALAAMLTVLFSSVVVTWLKGWREPGGRPAAVLSLVAVVATLVALPAQARRLGHLRHLTRVEGRGYHDLRALMGSPLGARLRSCPTTTLYLSGESSVAQLPYFIYSVYGGAADRVDGVTGRLAVASTGREGLLLERLQSQLAHTGLPENIDRGVSVPPWFTPVGSDQTWAAWTRGC